MNRSDFTLIASMIAGKVGVQCIPSNKYVWQASPKSKIIWYPKSIRYTEADMGYLLHEASHIRFSGVSHTFDGEIDEWIEKTGKSAEQIWHLVNAFEDGRIENELIKLYPGAHIYFEAAYGESMNLQYTEADNYLNYRPEVFEELQQKKWLHYCQYVAWYHSLGKTGAEEYINIWNAESEELRAAINATEEFFSLRYNCKNTDELVQLLQEKILVHYLPLCDDQSKSEEEKKKFEELMKQLLEMLGEMIKARAAMGEGEGKEGKGGKSGSGGGKGGKGTDSETVTLGRPGDFMSKKGDRKESLDKKRQFSKTGGGGWGSVDKDFGAMFDPEIPNELNESLLNEYIRLHTAQVRKAVSIIKDLETTRYEGNYASGKLQNRKLYKLNTKQYRIFTKKVADKKDNMDMVFGLVVDESGSMRSPDGGKRKKSQEATIATAVLGKALDMSGKAYAIYGFNRYFCTHKSFEGKMKIPEMLKIETNAYGGGSGDNNDGWAVNLVAQELLKRPERNKIMIVLSDGQPAPDSAHRHFDLETEVKNAEKHKIKVYGVGINNSSVRHYYSKHIVINDTSQLGNELAKIFKENVGARAR